MKTFIIVLFALIFTACRYDDPLMPIPDDRSQGVSRTTTGSQVVWMRPAEPEPPDRYVSPCEVGQYADSEGNCFWPGEIPEEECNDDIEMIVHGGDRAYVAADAVGPMVAVNAADGVYLYGFLWNGNIRFEGRRIVDGQAIDIQHADDGRFMVPYRDADGGRRAFSFNGTGQGTAFLLPSSLGAVQAADGRHLIAQSFKEGGEWRDIAFANVNGFDDVDVFDKISRDFPDADNVSGNIHSLSVRNDVWAYDDWTAVRNATSQTVRYELTVMVHDRNAGPFLGLRVYEETAAFGAYRWAKANAIVAQEGGFAVVWEKGTEGYGSESFLTFISYVSGGSFSGSIVSHPAVQDMVVGEHDQLLAAFIDEGVSPREVRLLRSDFAGTLLENRFVAQVDSAYAVRITHAANRTALTWSTEPNDSGTDGQVKLLILCE